MVERGRWLGIHEFSELNGIAPRDVRALIREGVLDAVEVPTPNGPFYVIWAQDAQAPTPPPAPMETVELPPVAAHGGRGSFRWRMKIGAGMLGIPVEEYLGHIADGERWCTYCKRWQPASQFGIKRRGPGLIAKACRPRHRDQAKRETAREGERWCAGHRSWEPEAAFSSSDLEAGPGGARCIAWRALFSVPRT